MKGTLGISPNRWSSFRAIIQLANVDQSTGPDESITSAYVSQIVAAY